MIDLKKLADRLEQRTLSREEERLNEIYNTFYYTPHTTIGPLREGFDTTTIEELKDLYMNVLCGDHYDHFEHIEGILGGQINSSAPLQCYWNYFINSHYWQKLKEKKKRFI